MGREKAVVEQDPEKPVERKVLAQAILEISTSLKKLLDSGLNEKAVVALVADATNVGRPDIRAVLASLKDLHRNYCTHKGA